MKERVSYRRYRTMEVRVMAQRANEDTGKARKISVRYRIAMLSNKGANEPQEDKMEVLPRRSNEAGAS